MASPLSGFGSLSGPGSTRRLGTESGAIRREARKLKRAGGNPQRLLEAAAMSSLREGSAIQSADSNIAEDEYERRAQSGFAAARQGVLREMAATPATGSATAPSVSGGTTPPTAGSPHGGVAPASSWNSAKPPSASQGVRGKTDAEKFLTQLPSTPLASQGAGGKTDAEKFLTQLASNPQSVGGDTNPSTAPPMVGPPHNPLAERRLDSRGSVLKDILARANATGSTRRSVLADVNSERLASGKAPVDFENSEFLAESKEQMGLIKSNKAKAGALMDAYSKMTHNKEAPYPESVPGLTVDLDEVRRKSASKWRKDALSQARDTARSDARRLISYR